MVVVTKVVSLFLIRNFQLNMILRKNYIFVYYLLKEYLPITKIKCKFLEKALNKISEGFKTKYIRELINNNIIFMLDFFTYDPNIHYNSLSESQDNIILKHFYGYFFKKNFTLFIHFYKQETYLVTIPMFEHEHSIIKDIFLILNKYDLNSEISTRRNQISNNNFLSNPSNISDLLRMTFLI